MKPLELSWKSVYQTGIEEVDFQHCYFAKLIKRLSDELAENKDASYRKHLIQELFYYARFHFISEENLMMKYGYPDIENHKELHLSLIDELTGLNSSYTPDALLEFLSDWFISHTKEEDYKFGQFVQSLSNTKEQA